MSLNKEIRSLPAGAKKTKGQRSLLQNTGTHTGLPGFPLLSKDSWRKAMFLLIAVGLCLGPEWSSTWLEFASAVWLCGLETDAYEFKVAVSLQLSFCEAKLHNLQSALLISSSCFTNACVKLTRGFRKPEWAPENYSWPLNNVGLNCAGPLVAQVFSVNTSGPL